jgi:carboxylate-amine ligase
MRPKEPSFTFGIEEEYHLVDLATRGFAAAPAALMEACEAALGEQVAPEFFRSQIEVGTSVCRDFSLGRRELAGLRKTIARIAGEYGMAPIAASTHPFADRSTWRRP